VRSASAGEASCAVAADILFLKTAIRAISNGPGVLRPCEREFAWLAEQEKSWRRAGEERKKRIRVTPKVG
jgi:hypothetical protein